MSSWSFPGDLLNLRVHSFGWSGQAKLVASIPGELPARVADRDKQLRLDGGLDSSR
jgi:hypothetical protein